MQRNLPGMNKFFAAEKGEAAPAVETFENVETAKTDDIASVLHYDPFKKGEKIPEDKVEDKTETKPNGKAKEAKAEAGNETNLPPKEDKTSTSKKPATEAKPEQSADYWRALAEERDRQLVAAKAPKEEKVDKKDDIKIPDYNFTIPKELIADLQSPENFERGLTHLLKGMAGAIHAQMAGYFQEAYNPRFESVPAMISQVLQAHQKAKEVSDDFYGTYPQYNRSQLKPIVKQLGMDLAKKLKKTEWDTELRDAIAEELEGIINVTAVKPNGTTPPRMLPSGGARAATKKDDVSQEIADTLFTEF